MTHQGTSVVRWNAHGCRYVVGKNVDGRTGLFVDNGVSWIPFDEQDLDEARLTLNAQVGEVLYVSIYRMPEESGS